MSERRAKQSRRQERAARGAEPRSRQRGHSRGSRKAFGGWVFLALVAGILGTAAYLLKPAFLGFAPDEEVGVIDVAADMGGFNQAVIRVKVGERVSVRLTSLDNKFHIDGGGKHQFAIDELDVNIIAPPLGSASATFTPKAPGVYLFYCDICCGGRANPTMSGKFIVEA
jgi:cytochrome c oxidase subunit II